MAVGHEQLRVVERRAAVEHALVGERLEERDDGVDLGIREHRHAERLDGGHAVGAEDRRDVAAYRPPLEDTRVERIAGR